MKIAFNNYVQDVLALKKEVEEYNKTAEKRNHKFYLVWNWILLPTIQLIWKLNYFYPFDYVIGTVHFINDENIGRWKANEIPLEERFLFYERYYAFIAELAKWGKTDIIAHPDFVKIHIFDFYAWLKQDIVILLTFEIIKKLNMVLEVSTGGLIKECHEIQLLHKF